MTPTTQILEDLKWPKIAILSVDSLPSDKAEEAKTREELEFTREVRHTALHFAMNFYTNAAEGGAERPSDVIAAASAFESYLRGE